MFTQIKRLGADTAVYGISTIVGRFLSFLLVPFYTNVLVPGEYGIVTYVYALIAFVNVIYSYGLESAYFKYAATLEKGTAKETFSTSFLTLCGSSLLLSALLLVWRGDIAARIDLPASLSLVLPCCAGMLAFDAIALVPFASLRMERKAKTFALLKLLNIVINVISNIILLVYYRMGVEGVFISGVIASGATALMLLPTIYRHLTLSVRPALLSALIRFGVPTIPSGLAAMVIQVIDRPILRAFTDDATVGIYQANYKLGIFMMLIVSMFDYAWRPFFFSTAKEVNAKEIFSRVLTYLVLGMGAVFLFFSLYIDDIVRLSYDGHYLIRSLYWSGLPIVPIVLLGYLFLGISTSVTAGLYIEKKTRWLIVGTATGAVINIVANYVLIPLYGIYGAAWATLLAYVGMAVAGYLTVRRFYPVTYEWRRILVVFACAGVCFAIFLMMRNTWGSMLGREGLFAAKCAVMVLFISLLAAAKFFTRGEIMRMRSVLTSIMNRRILS
jgi:O-antigen/teichoic acid export membrane protein